MCPYSECYSMQLRLAEFASDASSESLRLRTGGLEHRTAAERANLQQHGTIRCTTTGSLAVIESRLQAVNYRRGA